MRVHHLTGATDDQRPTVCHSCVWWQTRDGGRDADRRRWIDDVESSFGAWGKLYVEDGVHIASLQYGPAPDFPRARTLPAGPASDDAVLVTCAYLTDPHSPWALQSLFLACISECRDRRLPAVEAFAFAHGSDAEFEERFLVHRTIFPRDFLADYGFCSLRSEGAIELMRLDLRSVIKNDEGEHVLAETLRRARAIISNPQPASP